MEYIKLNKENIANEHICCAIGNEKDIQVCTKKKWLTERFDEGLVFLKANVRGKCFIEYVNSENAWVPIDIKDYLFIDCLWVSGQFKGHGYSSELLQQCIDDGKARNKKGLIIITSEKKRGFLADKKFLLHKGFILCDKLDPYFELMYLPFDPNEKPVSFNKDFSNSGINEDGITIVYSDQCPFTAKYVPLLIAQAQESGIKTKAIHVETKKQAQCLPTGFTTFSLFYKGQLVTHEIQSEKKFADWLASL